MPFSAADIDEAKRLLNSISDLDTPTFEKFAQSDSAEIKTLLYEYVCDKSLPFNHLDEALVDQFCIDFLVASFRSNSPSEAQFSRFDAATELTVWCDTFLKEGKHPLLLKMRDVFAELWLQGDSEDCRVLATRILENIFQNDKIRGIFENWSTDPELSVAYAQGVEFARLLKEKGKEKGTF
jgi:hypothetical protein